MKNTRQKSEHYGHRIIAFVMALVLCVSLFPMVGTVNAGSWDANLAGSLKGAGTADNPYEISTGAELAKLMNGGTGYAKLMNDIDLSEHYWISWNFSGTLDGKGHMISGIKIGRATSRSNIFQYVGLVGKLSGTIKNLAVEVTMYSEGISGKVLEMGGIAGRLTGGTVDNCTVTGVIDGYHSDFTSAFGGIVGRGDGGLVVNCTNRASVNGAVSKAAGDMNVRVAGIVGQGNGNLTIANCVNYGNIHIAEGAKSLSNCGAAGICVNKSSLVVSNCLNLGSLTKDSTNAPNGSTGDIIVEGGTTTCTNAYSYNGSQYFKYGDESKTFADHAKMVTELNNNIKSSGSTGWLTWVKGKDGMPVPGADIVPRLLLGTVTISDNVEYGQTLTANLTNCNLQSGLTYQWYRSSGNGFVAIPGATGMAYTVSNDDIGRRLQFVVSSSGYDNTLTATTASVGLPEGTPLTSVDPIYIDSDAAENGDGTFAKPFRTLEEARTKIRQILSQTPTADLTVYMMGGTYVLEQTFVLGEEESAPGRLTFKNYNGEKVVITSAHAITGQWTQVSGSNYYSYQLPASAQVDGVWPAFRNLLVDGKLATLAKSKEYTYVYSFENTVVKSNGTIDSCDNLLYISAELLEGITNTNLKGLELSHLNEWKTHIFHIGEIIDVKQNGEQQIKLNQAEFEKLLATDNNLKTLTNRKYWLQNHIKFLDEPNEFYYDQETGIIYYYPMNNQDLSSSSFAYATLDVLVEMENVSNITFDGITFTGTTANSITEDGLQTALGNTTLDPAIGRYDTGTSVPFSAIHGTSNISGVRILNCEFVELGGSGVVLELGVLDLVVSGNTFKNIGLAGVQIGKNQRQWNENGILGASEDVTITNNYITNIGLLAAGAPAIRVARSKNLNIQHNTIIHVPYSGIMAGWGWELKDTQAHNTNLTNVDISYNYIEDFMYKINDGGAIYVCGANDFAVNTELFNEIHHNYIRSGTNNNANTGVYHDGSSSNWYTHHNVIDDLVSRIGSMNFQDVVNNQHSHNITASNNYTAVGSIYTAATTDRNIVLSENLEVADRAALLAIPEAKAIMEGAGLEAAYAHIAAPMDVALQIQDNSMRYQISDIQTECTTINVKLTNNYTTDRTFTLSVAGDLPKFITCKYSSNGVKLAPGESAVVTLTLAVDLEQFVPKEDVGYDFVVTEDTGKTTLFPRQFVLRCVKLSKNEIAYGTPQVDGILDAEYLNSGKAFIDTVFDTTGEDMITTVEGRAYMLWDENYLYVYAIIHDETLMTLGIDFITEKYKGGEGNPHHIWQTDGVEAYIKTTHRDGKFTKFGVDAFGLQPFTNNKISFSVVDALPYVTRFTVNGEIVDFTAQNPAAGPLTGTDLKIDGYVVEFALPLTSCTELQTESTPQIGDVIEFYFQVNDYTKDYADKNGESVQNVVSSKSGKVEYVLVAARPVEEPVAEAAQNNVIIIVAICVGTAAAIAAALIVILKVLKKKQG